MAVSPIQPPLGRDFSLPTLFILLSRVTFVHMYRVLLLGKKPCRLSDFSPQQVKPRIKEAPVQKKALCLQLPSRPQMLSGVAGIGKLTEIACEL